MCFCVDTPKQVAMTDIICWKLYRRNAGDENGFTSPFWDFRYTFGKMYSGVMDEPDYRDEVDRGYHSYSSFKKARKEQYRDWNVVRCYIPEGSEMYYNEYRQEYVSDCIRITDIRFTNIDIRFTWRMGFLNFINLIKEKFAK